MSVAIDKYGIKLVNLLFITLIKLISYTSYLTI